ncbi:hypothetical protein M422DRAFT_202564 [Sphaerobolus stellatus SS14]|nr:hypothetical protein M422DRAFT_202564 [Sphaerobolus stellatus SS14]
MTPETYNLFRGVVGADAAAVEHALVRGADVNAADELGRNVLTYASLGAAINALECPVQPRLSENRLDVLKLVAEHPQLSLYSLNAPMPWAEGVTLLGLMSWLNMPSEIMCLLEFTQGLMEANAMDNNGATPLMYAARDGNVQVVRRLLAHGARPDLRDIGQRSAVQFSLPHLEILWLLEETLRRSRASEDTPTVSHPRRRRKYRPTTPFPGLQTEKTEDLFYPKPDSLLSLPPATALDLIECRRIFDSLLSNIRKDDLEAIQKCLIAAAFITDSSLQHSGSHGFIFLVNFRDSMGLSLLHHAVSQRRTPSIAIVDALHNAGADMGLYSSLGFTPLHHLVRTTKEDPAYMDVPVYKRPLYAFTMHIIQDLRAPLAATDNRGETPLHAAAEHGRSISILQAMLDCDKAFFGKESVRESRNERGLRPMDIAKPEFLHVFVGEQVRAFEIPVVPDLPPSILPSTPGTASSTDRIRSLKFSRSSRSTPSGILGKKPSTTSLMSRSSGSSSDSSGIQSIGSVVASSIQHSRSFQQRKMGTATQTLPTPDPTPPGSFSGSPSTASGVGMADIQNCTMDILYNLSFCGAALHSYSQQQPEIHPLPDLEGLLDNLHHSRLLASHVLGHWASNIDSFQAELNRIRAQIEKAQSLRQRVGRDINAAFMQSDRPTKFVDAFRLGDRNRAIMPAPLVAPARRDSRTSRTGIVRDTKRGQRASESSESSDASIYGLPSPVDLENATPRPRPSLLKFPDIDYKEQDANTHPSKLRLSLSSRNRLRSAPKVLERVDLDLERVTELFKYLEQSFKRCEDMVNQANKLAEDAISVRENQLDFLRRLYHGYSSRLSPIQERSSEAGHSRPLSPPFDEAGSIVLRGEDEDEYNPNVLAPIEEPHVLRRILHSELQKHVEAVCLDIQKAHVWLRIVREVLRGLRRRVVFEH